MGALKDMVQQQLGVAEFTCEDENGSPFQFEGLLNDGRPFYVRARGTRVSATVGFVGQSWNGMFDTPARSMSVEIDVQAHHMPYAWLVGMWKAAVSE